MFFIIKHKKNILFSILLLTLFIMTGCAKEKDTKEKEERPQATPIAAVVATPTPIATPAPTPVPTPTPTNRPEARVKVPILYYHAVNDQMEGIEELFVKPAEFEKQMKYLKDNNYTVITFDDLDKSESIKNPIIITFDDGYEDNYTYAYPVLKKYGFKATIFLCADFVGNPSILNKQQIKEMGDLINFQSHTLDHPDLTKIKLADAERQLSESKIKIEEMTGKPINAFAYPIGYYNESILQIVKKYYKYAVQNGGGIYTTGDKPLEMKRVYVPRWLDLQGFEKKIKGLQ